MTYDIRMFYLLCHPLEAAHGEVFEETGLEINIISLINVTSNPIRPDMK